MDTRYPITWVTSRMKLIGLLWNLQEGVCALCGKEMRAYSRMKSSNRLSVDHVWPRSKRNTRKGVARPPGLGISRIRYSPHNHVCAHGKCNGKKGDREPTGCELIWLYAVNARRGYDPLGWRPREKAA